MNTSKLQAGAVWLLMSCLALVLGAVGCASPRPAPQGSEQTEADATEASDDPCSEMFSDFFVEADSITYGGYEVVRQQKTVRDPEYSTDILVTYAILRSDGRTIATFDGTYFGAGNQTNFGFATLLGGDSRQLLVSQTIPRGGHHWIVDLSSNVTTLFNSKEWQLGDEDVCVHDFDNDGISEISMAITRFWGFDKMSMAESPMPEVVFRYEPAVRKYLPDKLALARGLGHIEQDVRAIDPGEDLQDGLKGAYLAVRLDILLRYVYAGRESDGWSFFDNDYNLPDKQDISREIKRILNSEPVYRFVYGLPPLQQNLAS